MKLPFSMLRELASTTKNAEEIGDLLTMAGFELEGLESVEGEPVLDIKVVANRGDGLSALGLAREVLAKDSEAEQTDLYRSLSHPGSGASGTESIRIETSACSRYAYRIFRDVENGPSPEWLQQRIRQAGWRPISLLVDLGNYVMLEMGQPLHAFDLEKLGGAAIVVREAQPGEKLITLDGTERELQPGMMLICTPSKPVALAGIMGGLDTEVGAQTSSMLLESAHFEPASVRKTRTALGMGTEASYRFERWVDPNGVTPAIRRFSELYQQITGKPVDSVIFEVVRSAPEQRNITLNMGSCQRLLGMSVPQELAIGYLRALGCTVEEEGDRLKVTPPSWRPDLVREEDLVEEIGRVHGYDKIPETPIQGTAVLGGVKGYHAIEEKVRQSILRSGFHQIISHSLRDRHKLDYRETKVSVRNPHSPEMAILRDSLLPGLAEAALRNGGRDLHLFEIGKVFVQGEVQVDESPELGILTTGRIEPPHWKDSAKGEADFFSLKGVLEAIATNLGIEATFVQPRQVDRRFHPTRQAGMMVDEGRLWAGYFGQIHPDLAQELGLPEQTCIAEIDLLVLAFEHEDERNLRQFSRNPAVRRDISILIDKSVPYAHVERAITESCGDVLEKQWLFDLYSGPGIPEEKQSLAIAMQLRKMGANLTDEEANQVRDSAVAALERLGAKQR